MPSQDPQKLSRLARIMAHVCLAAFVLIPLGYLAIWFRLLESHDILAVHGSQAFIAAEDTSILQRLAGFGLSMAPQLALLYGLYRLREMFVHIGNGQVFAKKSADQLRAFARALLLYAVLSFIVTAPLSALVSWHNPPGERFVQLSIGENDLQVYFLIALFYVLAHIVSEGIRLARENAEFV